MAPGWPSGSFRSSWATLRVFSTSYEDLAWNHLFWCVCIYLIYLIYFHLCILNVYIYIYITLSLYHSITLSASVSIRIYRSLGTIILTSHSRNGRPDFGDRYSCRTSVVWWLWVFTKSSANLGEVHQISAGKSDWGWPWWFWMILALLVDSFGTARLSILPFTSWKYLWQTTPKSR